MSINNIRQQRLPSLKNTLSEQPLKPGQIVRGKIMKLHPGSMAEIQIGNKNLIAKLEASISLGERYHFQVQTTDDVIYLKVLGDILDNQANVNNLDLLKQLGFKQNKHHAQFLQTLVNDAIPFEINQLKKALQILDTYANKEKARHILKEMIASKKPITSSVFEALASQEKDIFSKQMKIFASSLQDLSQTDSYNNKLLNKMEQLIERPLNTAEALFDKIKKEINGQNKYMFHALKLAGCIEENVNYQKWVDIWSNDSDQTDNNKVNSKVMAHLLTNNVRQILDNFNQIMHHQPQITKNVNEFESLFLRDMNTSIFTDQPLNHKRFQQLIHFIKEAIVPLLPQHQKVIVENDLKNLPESMDKLLQNIQTLKNDTLFSKIAQFLQQDELNQMFLSRDIQERFMLHLRNTLHITGLAYEHELANGKQELEFTLKGMLLRVLQQGNINESKQANQLLHVLNGLQLNSVNDLNNFIYTQLQIPGQKIGLKSDMELNIEGRKQNDGKIDTDYCRIHFYLDLTNFRQTIIDMNVQKRTITMTIYNDTAGMERVSFPYQSALKESLEKLNYHLSSISFKPFANSKEVQSSLKHTKEEQETVYNGVDYRI